MTSASTCANYLLTKAGVPYSIAMLHRLLFMAQVWHLTLTQKLLFPDTVHAWATGPVVLSVYDIHPQFFEPATVEEFPPGVLSVEEQNILDCVWEYYHLWGRAVLDAHTQQHPFWRKARKGLADLDRGRAQISFGNLRHR